MPSEFDSTTAPDESCGRSSPPQPPVAMSLMVAWSRDAKLLGHAFVVPPLPIGNCYVIGRGTRSSQDPYPRLLARAEHPIHELQAAPLVLPRVSRVQLIVKARGQGLLAVQNVGRSQMLHNGCEVASADVGERDTIQIGTQLLLLCV